MMIEKKIHYCWFGGSPLSELAKKCIESWKRYCPDYEIVQWDETNFNISSCDYVHEAYEKQKWAFVSDYARFMILYQYGGIYFDTDVELIKPIDDIVSEGPFMGLEAGNLECPAPGLGMASYPKMEIFREILDYYDLAHFEKNENGSYKTVVDITTEILLEHGRIYSDRISEICGIKIYPPDYFCPLNYYTGELRITDNSHSIHHYAATWISKETKKMLEIRKRISGKNELIHLCGICHISLLHVVDVIKRRGIRGAFLWGLKRFR